MFTGSKVMHKVFGEGTIVKCDVDDLYNARLEVEFADSCRAFALKSFADEKFFKVVPDNLRSFAKDIEKQHEELKALQVTQSMSNFKQRESHVNRAHQLDEEKKPVTKADWQKAYDVAGDYRFLYESRAVIVDGVLYIHATAACVDRGLTHRESNKAYKACESGGKYNGSKWFYATKEDIFENCLKGDNK